MHYYKKYVIIGRIIIYAMVKKMAIVTVSGLSMDFGEQKLFDDMYFEVQNDDRIGLIGVNGCGKTTLFKLLTVEMLPTGGTIVLNKNTVIGYMEQHVCRDPYISAYDEVLTVFRELADMENELEILNEKINSKPDDINKLIERQTFLNDEFTRREGLTFGTTTAGTITSGPFIDILEGLHQNLLLELKFETGEKFPPFLFQAACRGQVVRSR